MDYRAFADVGHRVHDVVSAFAHSFRVSQGAISFFGGFGYAIVLLHLPDLAPFGRPLDLRLTLLSISILRTVILLIDLRTSLFFAEFGGYPHQTHA